MQVHKNGPGDALFNQERWVDTSFVLATGFLRFDLKQGEQNNRTPDFATQNILPFLCPNRHFGSCPEQERGVVTVARIYPVSTIAC